jgi:hypothetical protein
MRIATHMWRSVLAKQNWLADPGIDAEIRLIPATETTIKGAKRDACVPSGRTDGRLRKTRELFGVSTNTVSTLSGSNNVPPTSRYNLVSPVGVPGKMQ